MKVRVEFEDGHAEEFAANHVQYANAGGLILSWNEEKPPVAKVLPNGQVGHVTEFEQRLACVIGPPHGPAGSARNWCRVTIKDDEAETIDTEQDLVTLADGRREPNESVLRLTKEAN